MNWRFAFLIGVLVALLVACGEEKKPLFKRTEPRTLPFIFSMAHYFSDDERTVSFPIWFNDSLIRKHRIHFLRRTLYERQESRDTLHHQPKEVKSYFFDKNGSVKAFELERFYDNFLIGRVHYEYLSKKDENGFALAKKKRFKGQVPDLGEEFEAYSIEQYAKKFLVYTNEQTGAYLFFMKDPTNWGPLSIDTVLHPEPQDFVVLGTPLEPHKKYRVENMVNESDVVEYTYSKRGGGIKSVQFDQFPFKTKRSMTYDKDGNCTGFIDSTFSNAHMISRRVSRFQFKDGLPVQLIHQIESAKSKSHYTQKERFEYEFLPVK